MLLKPNTFFIIFVLGLTEDTLRVEQTLASCWSAGSVSLSVSDSDSRHGQASAVDAMCQAEAQRMELAHEKSVAAWSGFLVDGYVRVALPSLSAAVASLSSSCATTVLATVPSQALRLNLATPLSCTSGSLV